MRPALAASLIVLAVAVSAQAPAFNASPLRLSFIAAAGGSVPVQTVQIRQVGPTTVAWRAQASAPWILVSAASGTGDAALQIGVDTRSLPPGRHEGRVTLSSATGASPIVVVVVLQIQGRSSPGTPAAGAGPALSLSSPPGSREATSAELVLEDTDDAPASFRVKPDQPWVTVEPASGDVPARLVISARPDGLSPGEHRATLALTDGEGRPWMRVPIVYAVGGTEPLSITADVLPPATRNLPYAQAIPIRGGKPPYTIRIAQGRLPQGLVLSGGSISGATRHAGSYPLVLAVSDAASPPATVTQPLLLQVIVLYQDTALVVSPPSLSLTIRAGQRSQGARLAIGSGRQPLAWRVDTDASWLRLAPDRGLSPSLLQVDINSAALEPGTYTATLTVTMEGAPNSPARVPVQVEIRR